MTHRSAGNGFKVWRPGRLEYRDAQARQERLVEQRRGWGHDLLVLLEHPPVITLGRRADPGHLLHSPAALARQGIDCVTTRRGGDVTLHNPGQLVGYPIVDLDGYGRDLHRFLRLIELLLVQTLADFGLAAAARPGYTGVWAGPRKIASIGVAVRRWISYHGFSLNIDNDLAAYEAIVPCGLPGVSMTSMRRELGHDIDREAVSERLVRNYETILQRNYLGNYREETFAQA